MRASRWAEYTLKGGQSLENGVLL